MVESQHWIGPVVQAEVGSGPVAVSVMVTVLVVVGGGGLPPGMAAARIARERTK